MILDQHPEDRCYKIGMEKRARCSGCGKWIEHGEVAWSYQRAPVDGNYVEHEYCRYGWPKEQRDEFNDPIPSFGSSPAFGG